MYLYFDLQTYDKARNAVALALSPVVRALVDPDGAMRQIRDLDNVCILFIILASRILIFWCLICCHYFRGIISLAYVTC